MRQQHQHCPSLLSLAPIFAFKHSSFVFVFLLTFSQLW